MKLFILLILSILPMLIIPAFADTIITLDGVEISDTSVTLTGTVFPVDESSLITIKILKDATLLQISQLTPSQDGSYSVTSDITSKWGDDEIYKIIIIYEGKQIDVFFNLIDGIIPKPSIGITLDKSTYSNGEIIYVDGTVPDFNDDSIFRFEVLTIDGIRIMLDEFQVNSDTTFSGEIELDERFLIYGGECLITGNYLGYNINYSFELIPSPPPLTLDFQFSQPTYSLGDIIEFTGNIEHFDENEELVLTIDLYLEDGTPISLLQDDGTLVDMSYDFYPDVEGSFKGTIPNPSTTYDNQDIQVIAKITVQDVEFTESFYSYYMPNNSNEILYDMAVSHDETLELHDSLINNNMDDLTSYSVMLQSHDFMLFSHDSILNHQDNVISQQNQTQVDQSELILNLNDILSQQTLEIQQNKIDIAITTGFLTNLNVTLSVDAPPVLTDEALQEIIYENQRQRDEIAQLNISIAENHILLEEAIIDGKENKIDKFKRNIASDEVSRAHAQARINMSDLLLLVYPQ